MTDSDGEELQQAIAERVTIVRQRIESATDSPNEVTLVAVSKRHSVNAVLAGAAIGLVDFGENYAQELAGKAAELGQTTAEASTAGDDQSEAITRAADAIRWHFVGGLQRNRIKTIAASVYLWQSIDRPELARTLAHHAPGARILVQVNTTGEAQKSGCAPDDASSIVDEAKSLGLQVEGLMTLGPTAAGEDPRPSFDALAELRDRLELRHLSMGMSGDLEVAIRAGATIVRVGTDIFGVRP